MKVEDAIKVPCPQMSDSQGEIQCNGNGCPIWRSHEYIHWLKSERSPEGYKKPSNEMLRNHHKTYDKKTNYNWFYCEINKDEGECGLITIGCEGE